jgi:hypothetical protein
MTHAALALMLRSAPTRRALARALAAEGRGGDTVLAHIDPREARLLRALGGAGTRNPKTGLPEFHGGGMGGAADQDINDHDFSGGADRGTGLRGPTDGTGQLASHTGATGPAGGVNGSAVGAHWGGVGSDYESAFSQRRNLSPEDSILNALGHVIPGLHYASEPVPGYGPSYAGGTWHTGWSPAEAIGSIAGMASGVPGLGTVGGFAGDQLAQAMGWHDVMLGGPGSGLAGQGGSFAGRDIGAAGNAGNHGNWGGLGGLGGAASASQGQPGGAGAAGSSLPAAPAAAAAAPVSPALVPLMSQGSPDLTGGRFGAVPSWATQGYQIGSVPAVNQPPSIPGTPFGPAAGSGGSGSGGGTGTGTGGTTQTNRLTQALLAQYPQLAQLMQSNPALARRLGYA